MGKEGSVVLGIPGPKNKPYDNFTKGNSHHKLDVLSNMQSAILA